MPPLSDALTLLQVASDHLLRLRRAKSYTEACKAMEALQKEAARQFKRKAFELHPDRTGNDPAKTEEFRKLTEAIEVVRKMRVQKRAKRPKEKRGGRVQILSCTRPQSSSGSPYEADPKGFWDDFFRRR